MTPVSPFLRNIPRKSLFGFMLGVFFIFTTSGIATDVLAAGAQPPIRLVAGVSLSGLFAVCYAFWGFRLRRRFWKVFIPLFVLQIALMSILSNAFPDQTPPVPMSGPAFARLQGRLTIDGVVIIVSLTLAYICFVYVAIAEARRYFRVHTEMLLAAEIHRVIVPAIDTKIGSYEFCGRSLPSGEVGGDLIDVFEHHQSWIAYVADVSGHGVAPGVVMAMVKSATRMQLSSPEDDSVLLERLNDVLFPIKKAEMFVTFAYLTWNGRQLAYCTAGHPPILHYHAATQQISELECNNLPVGMFNKRQFVTGSITAASDDVFLMLTDGVLDVANPQDEEFALSGVKEVLSAHAHQPLPGILNAIVDATNRHGRAADDRSVLLVRLANC